MSLPAADYEFMVFAGGVTAVLTFAGAAGAVLSASIGALTRNTGGAVTGAVLGLIVAPPLIVQLVNEAPSWVPSTLANVLSGVGHEVSRPAALLALAAWAILPALVGLVAVQNRDVV